MISKITKNLTLPFSFQTLKYVFFGLVSIAWISAFFSGYNISTGDFFWGKTVDKTGELAWKLLIFTVFISLFQKLFPKIKIFSQLLPLRKFTGIFAFLIAFSHIAAAFMKWDFLNYPLAENLPFITEDISMIFGSIAFLAMLPAFVTSTLWALKTMGARFWKNVQRLTHGAFVFTALHIIFLKFHFKGQLDAEPIVPLLIYLIGYGFLFWKKRR